MSSLHIINKSTRSKKGGGLPFYDNVDFIFSALNECFNSDDGLWTVPNDKAPTFQLIVPYDTLVSFRFRQTLGANNFIPSGMPNWFYDNASLQAALTSTNIQVDGSPFTIWEVKDSSTLTPVIPFGKWVVELVLNDGVEEQTFWSEEFTVRDGCLC